MFSFDFDKNIFLGIDIGTSSVKIVELKVSGGKPVLSNYAYFDLPDVSGKDDYESEYYSNILPAYLQAMIKKAQFKAKKAYVSLPSSGGLITEIEFPRMPKEDIEQAIRYEAHKYIPTSIEDVVLSWDIVGQGDEKKPDNSGKKIAPDDKVVPSDDLGGKIEVILVAASKNKVAKYEKIIKSVGLELKAIEIESFSLVNSLVRNDPGNFIIIDIGSRVCNILLVEKGIIKANRNIDAGGKDLTKVISRGMMIDEDKAEKIKVSGRNFFGNEAGLNFPTLEAISEEVSRMINAYYKNQPARIDNIILSGGTAQLAGLPAYFEKSLKIKTVLGNPFSRLEYDTKLAPVVAKTGSQFSVSLGLALKGVNEFLNKK